MPGWQEWTLLSGAADTAVALWECHVAYKLKDRGPEVGVEFSKSCSMPFLLSSQKQQIRAGSGGMMIECQKLRS